jgi:hypothetical protein
MLWAICREISFRRVGKRFTDRNQRLHGAGALLARYSASDGPLLDWPTRSIPSRRTACIASRSIRTKSSKLIGSPANERARLSSASDVRRAALCTARRWPSVIVPPSAVSNWQMSSFGRRPARVRKSSSSTLRYRLRRRRIRLDTGAAEGISVITRPYVPIGLSRAELSRCSVASAGYFFSITPAAWQCPAG